MLATTAGALLLVACASHRPVEPPAYDDATSIETGDRAQVTCVLPGQIRQLGHMTYLSPNRVITTSASECEIRGGSPRTPAAPTARSS